MTCLSIAWEQFRQKIKNKNKATDTAMHNVREQSKKKRTIVLPNFTSSQAAKKSSIGAASNAISAIEFMVTTKQRWRGQWKGHQKWSKS